MGVLRRHRGDLIAQKNGPQAVILPCRKRRNPRAYHAQRYARCHCIERLICYLKQFRRLATRYDKLDVDFLAFVTLVATIL